MAQIKYTQLEQSLKSSTNEYVSQLFLLWGEKYITDEAADYIVSTLISKKQREISYTCFTGENITLHHVADEVSTFSAFLEKKVIFARDMDFSKDELKKFSKFVDNKIPENHFLILSLSKIDKRSSFFKIIKERGLVVDCFIPTGLSKRERDVQIQFLRSQMIKVLNKSNKEIQENAFIKLIDLTGFDINIFIDNLEKLVSYIGKNKTIDLQTVSKLVQRSKTDPIFEFTNAFSNKNIKKALFFLSSLINSNFHVLQILKALTNHVRKVFAVKCFIEIVNAEKKKIWTKNQDFSTFNNHVVPEIKKSDTALVKEFDFKEKSQSDFFLASNSNSNYPEYQLFKKSDNFSIIELENILIELSELDNKFKSSSQDEQILIKDFLFKNCN